MPLLLLLPLAFGAGALAHASVSDDTRRTARWVALGGLAFVAWKSGAAEAAVKALK